MMKNEIDIPELYILGAGPGDPELITMIGYKILQQARVVLYDNLANKKLLDITPPGCEHIYVGKQPDGRYTTYTPDYKRGYMGSYRHKKRRHAIGRPAFSHAEQYGSHIHGDETISCHSCYYTQAGHGSTPVAIIQHTSTSQQKSIRGLVENLPAMAESKQLTYPAIIIGAVTSLSN